MGCEARSANGPGGKTPSHRNTLEIQPEVCDLCGVLVAANRLVTCNVEGLRGAAVCDTHPWEQVARFRPSYNDLRRTHPAPHLAAEQELETTGAALWFRDTDPPAPDADPETLPTPPEDE